MDMETDSTHTTLERISEDSTLSEPDKVDLPKRKPIPLHHEQRTSVIGKMKSTTIVRLDIPASD